MLTSIETEPFTRTRRRASTPPTADATLPYSAPAAGRGWDALILCLSGFILTSVGRIHQLFPVLEPLRPVTLTGGLAILLCLLDRTSPRRIGTLRLSATRYLLAFVAWLALSVPGALWPGGAFNTFVDFAKTALIFLVIVTAVRSARDIERLTWVYFLAAVIFALVVLVRMRSQIAAEGRLERLYFYDSNDFAAYVVTAVPLGLYFALTHRRRLLRALSWGGIGLLAVGFIWCGSRGGFLALLAVMAYVLLRYTAVSMTWRIAAIVVIGVLGAATASESFWTRISTVLRPTEDYNVTSEHGRMQIWRRGIGYMIQHPLLGVGAGNFPRAEGTISPLVERRPRRVGLKWGPPHNSYVQVAAELGVPGFFIFAGFLVSVFGALRKVGDSPPVVPPGLVQSLTAALIGFVVGAFFLTLAYQDMLYTLAALAVGIRKVRIDALRLSLLQPQDDAARHGA